MRPFEVTNSVNPEEAGIHTRPSDQELNRWDKIVLIWLYKTYFPGQGNRPQGYGNLTFDIPGIFVETFRSFF